MSDVFPTCPGCKQRVCTAEDSGREVDGVYWCGDCRIKILTAELTALRETMADLIANLEKARVHAASNLIATNIETLVQRSRRLIEQSGEVLRAT